MIPNYRVFFICLCLAFFVFFLACDEDNTASLRLQCSLSPSIAARVQQGNIGVVVYIDDVPTYEFEITSISEQYEQEYEMDLDSFGRKMVRVRYLDSAGRIISEGRGAVNIQPGENSVRIILSNVIIRLDPDHVRVGDAVTVIGEHFDPGDEVQIDFRTVEVTPNETAGADNVGGFRKRFRISQDAQQGVVDVQATQETQEGGITFRKFAHAQLHVFNTTIQLEPEFGPVGTEVIVTGDNFGQVENVRFNFGGRVITVEPRAETGDDGHFENVRFTVPDSAPLGDVNIQGIGATSGRSAVGIFTVMDGPAGIRLDPTRSWRDTPVTVTGWNFYPGEGIQIDLGGSPVATTEADEQGDIVGGTTFIVPADASEGETPVQATGITSEKVAEALFTVLDEPMIELIPDSGPVYTNVVLNGQNFSPRSDVEIDFWQSHLTVMTDQEGNVNTEFSVPEDARLDPSDVPQEEIVQARDAQYEEAVTDTFTVTPDPSIGLNPERGCRGTRVTVTGANFGAREPVRIEFNALTVASISTNEQGNIAAGTTFAVPPNSSYGEAVVRVVETSSGRSAFRVFMVVEPAIQLDPETGCRGTQVTVTGQNFGDTESIRMDFGGAPVANLRTDSQGNIVANSTFQVPFDARFDGIAVSATGGVSSCAAQAEFTVARPSLELDPSAGCIGTEVRVVGENFGANENVQIALRDGQMSASTGPQGYFTADFTVLPNTPLGETVISARGSKSNCAETAPFEVVQPDIQLDRYAGCRGTRIVLTGQNFGAREGVQIYFGEIPVAMAGTNEQGNIDDTAFSVPADATSGDAVVSASGARSRCAAENQFTVLEPTILLQPDSGCAGAEVTLTGQDFLPNDDIQVFFRGNLIDVDTSGVNEQGDISSATFFVPTGIQPGEAIVRVRETELGCSAEAQFRVLQPVIELKPIAGCRDAEVILTGRGFMPGEIIEIDFGGVPLDIDIPPVDPQGNITSTTFLVPPEAQPGEVVVRVPETEFRCAADALFRVLQPVIQLTPATGCKNTEIALTGRDFLPGESIVVNFGDNRYRTSAYMQGDIRQVMLSVPRNASAGEISALATGSRSRCSAQASFVLIDASVQLDRYSGCPGAQVTVIEQNFGTPENTRVYFDGKQMSATTDDQGNTVFRVPENALAHVAVIRVEDPESGCSADVTFTVTKPAIILEPARGCRGTQVTLTVRGFLEDEVVQVDFGDRRITEPWDIIGTDAQGHFRTMTFNVSQNDPYTRLPVSAAGEASECAAMTYFTIASPSIELNVSNGCIGTELVLTGWNFGVREVINIDFDGIKILDDEEDIYTDGFGRLNERFRVPENAPTHEEVTVSVDGETSSCVATTQFRVIEPELTLERDSGCRGTQLIATGEDFGEGNYVQIDMVSTGWRATLGSAIAGTEGGFIKPLTIPGDAPAGQATVYASILASGCFATVPFTIRQPDIRLEPTIGCAGTTVSVTGDNFDPGEQVRVYLDDEEILFPAPIITDDEGLLDDVTFLISQDVLPGDTFVAVKGEKSACSGQAPFTVVKPFIQLESDVVLVDTTVGLVGSGFSKDRDVQIGYWGIGSIYRTDWRGYLPLEASMKIPSSALAPSDDVQVDRENVIRATDLESGCFQEARFSVRACIDFSSLGTIIPSGQVVTHIPQEVDGGYIEALDPIDNVAFDVQDTLAKAELVTLTEAGVVKEVIGLMLQEGEMVITLPVPSDQITITATSSRSPATEDIEDTTGVVDIEARDNSGQIVSQRANVVISGIESIELVGENIRSVGVTVVGKNPSYIVGICYQFD